MARVSTAVRKRTATVHTKDGKAKFPINDKRHAGLAIAREDQAKPPLTKEQRATVEREAAQYGVGPKAKNKSSKKGL